MPAKARVGVTATCNGVKVTSVKLACDRARVCGLSESGRPDHGRPFGQGPLRYPVTAWLSNIKIWNKQAKK